MRKDGRIYSDLDEFAFLGYSVREKNYPYLENQHKPNCAIITIDTMLGPIHPELIRPLDNKESGLKNHTLDLRTYDEIIKFYSDLPSDDQKKYAIFGYAIEHEGLFRYKYPSREWAFEDGYQIYKYLYSLFNIEEPKGSFKGFDVVEAEVEYTSALMNCGIGWEKAEQYGILNRNHLYTCYTDAKMFLKYANEIVEEHSPFSVWGIWEVR